MADSKPDKAQEQAKKDEQKKANMPIVTVCTLDLRQILVALHEKALKQVDGKFKSGELELTIQNSAIEGAGGKDAKFYGAGQHLIAAIPKDSKGLDKNKVQKKDALPALQTYVQWFVGPDLKKGVTDKDLKPLEDGAEGKVEDNHKKKEDIEKSRKDDISGEKYENGDETKKESTIFVPSFSQYLLTEEGEETPKDDSTEGEENKDEKKEDKPEEKKEEAKGPDTAEAQGWYVEYKMTIPGQKEHSILDAMKKLGADLLKAMGVKFTSLFGGADGKVHTIGDPLELVPGEDVKIPEIKNKGEKGEWEFMGFEPDPENMDESGYTYAIYTKNGPDTIKITFYDADPETGDKLKDPLGKPIEIKKGEQINQSDEAQTEFEKYDKQLESDKKEGYIFKGWNPDPSAKVDEDTDVVAKYIEEGEKDTKYTVMFQYAPDQEKPDDTEIIQVDGKDEQEVLAGEKATRPEVPEIEGYKFKDWGEDEKNLDNVQDDIVAVAQFSKLVVITPKAPKDPENPDKDLEPFGDPIDYDPKKPIEKQLPEPPEKKGWKPTGEWTPNPKDIKDPKEDIDIIPKYKKADEEKKSGIKLIFRAPKDPEKPDDTEIIGKKPIKYDPDLSIEDQAPQPPEFKGWHFKDWSPKLSDIKDPKDNTEIKAVYEKGIVIKFKIQDPAFKNKVVLNLKDAFDPINITKDNIDKVKFPNHSDAKDIPDGYATSKKYTWTITNTKEVATDKDLKDKIKSIIEKDNKSTEIFAVLNLVPKYDFTIKVVDVDPEKPNDESQEKLITDIKVIYDKTSGKNLYKPEDLKKISDAVHNSPYPDEEFAKYVDDCIDKNDEALKTIDKTTKSSHGDYKIKPEVLKKKIEAKATNPGIDAEKLPKEKRVVKVKTSYDKEQFRVKIVNPDPEDPENTKTQQDIATITVFILDDEKIYKVDQLTKLAKDTESKEEADKYNKAAKENEEAFKKVENLDALAKSAPNNSEGIYKFQGWAGPDGKTGKLEDLIANGPADGENEIVIKAQYNNDIKAKHTDLDFYIVPMKGLKDKDKHKDNTGSK